MSSPKNEQNDYDPKYDQAYNHGLKVVKVLADAGFDARFAGGCVRDRLMGQRPKDYDIATNAKPDEICSIFKQKGIKTVPTGIEHGTITVLMGGLGLEVTSLRLDVATDGRRAVVAFGSSFEEDSNRRDFTINALYEDVKGVIFDYHGGVDDLTNKVLRFVGDPEVRIQEDFLRILRLFRFWARFKGFQTAEGALDAVRKEVRGLEKISAERITSELLNTFECHEISKVIPSMYESGVLEVTLGLGLANPYRDFDWADLYLNKKTDTSLARLAALLWKLPDFSAQRRSMEKLKLSRIQKEKLLLILEGELPDLVTDPAVVFEWLDRVEAKIGDYSWQEFLYPIWRILRPSPSLMAMDRTISEYGARRSCLIDGQSLIRNVGINPGPELGALISELRADYRRGLWTTNEEALLRAKSLISKRKKPSEDV